MGVWNYNYDCALVRLQGINLFNYGFMHSTSHTLRHHPLDHLLGHCLRCRSTAPNSLRMYDANTETDSDAPNSSDTTQDALGDY